MRAAACALAALLIATPLLAQAQSTSDASASSLIAEITALEQQIEALTGSASTNSSASVSPAQPAAPANTNAGAPMCPAISRTLSLGSNGPDVSALQAFLAQEGVFSVSATGYFGTVTQTAVETWQAKEGIVSGGDPSTTGYGVVGPKTRAAIESACGGSSSQVQCVLAQPPVQECSTSWVPVLDAKGCTEYYTCSVPLPVATSSASTPVSSSPATTSAPAVCPVVVKPSCSGTVQPFGTDANGCVTSYECVL